ncbi:hypothetical protein VT84_25030 [Gemmata sp. SH-PL17]|uniref:hypothetical protein n=1 Tax=Gemmata sp. SH-PL17 TaxID=1630693 RepID=UPI00078EEFE9|nr:hypothetical protein [Gemmata sp. SH-PL17]AMV27689.1 hypothetical protein VT84_25030 [Gemmata sp. SH-PL17]
MIQTILNKRRRRLRITVPALARMSGVPTATVRQLLVDPTGVRFEHVVAVGRVLGLDLATARRVSVNRVLRDRALAKARYVARFVQGTQGLEAAAVDPAGYERIIEVAAQALLAGNKRKLWDED